MITFLLRYGDVFAYEEETIEEHRKLFSKKMGLGLPRKGVAACMCNKNRNCLTIETVTNDILSNEEFLSYYADKSNNVKTWFNVINLEKAEKDVLSKCRLISNYHLSGVSKSSMSPYFIVKYEENI